MPTDPVRPATGQVALYKSHTLSTPQCPHMKLAEFSLCLTYEELLLLGDHQSEAYMLQCCNSLVGGLRSYFLFYKQSLSNHSLHHLIILHPRWPCSRLSFKGTLNNLPRPKIIYAYLRMLIKIIQWIIVFQSLIRSLLHNSMCISYKSWEQFSFPPAPKNSYTRRRRSDLKYIKYNVALKRYLQGQKWTTKETGMA